MGHAPWPRLPYEPFAETRDVLHMWTQVVTLATGDPDAAVESFFNSAYTACAERAGWDRDELEGHVPRLPLSFRRA